MWIRNCLIFLGIKQPGCGLDLLGVCSHGRVTELFAESLINNQFYSKKCNSFHQVLIGRCNGTENALMGGEPVNLNLRGIFYLKTNSKSPFAIASYKNKLN